MTICRKVFFLAGLTLCVTVSGFGQVVTSAQHGFWHESSTWTGGIVPSSQHGDGIVITHTITVAPGQEISAGNITLSGTLIVEANAIFTLVALPEEADQMTLSGLGTLHVHGTLVGTNLARVIGTTDQNTFFSSTSRYIHQWHSKGHIPMAEWHPESTLEIAGFAGSGYIAIAFSESWKQHFGNVIYNCPLQTSFVDLNGYLSNIAGDFNIINTNGQALRLATTQEKTISIGGSLRIEGNSEVWCSTLSDSLILNIGKDFLYHSTSTGPSYFATRGKCWVTVGGKMEFDSPGEFRFCSGSADSTGLRKTTLNLSNGLSIDRGTFIAPSPGAGILVFKGTEIQHVESSAASYAGNFNFIIEKEATVDLGESILSSTTGSFHVKGILKVGSSETEGAIQINGSGNIQIAGPQLYYPDCSIVYNGSSPQWIGEGHPDHEGVNVVCENEHGITLIDDITLHHLEIKTGTLFSSTHTINVTGNIEVYEDAMLSSSASNLILTGTQNQFLSLNHTVLNNLTMHKEAGEVTLLSPLKVQGLVSITSNNTTLNSDGNLILLSQGDAENTTASVGPLATNAFISGDVTVERYMGAGRIYRYIASPVYNATVAMLMDDFPITGLFKDPSKGRGINSLGVSFFYYDESVDELSSGWKPYPPEGYAADHILETGRGYSAFIRDGNKPTIWDVTGVLHQGTLQLPIQFTATSSDDIRGWNLVGNPYASAIDWDKEEGWTKSEGLSKSIAVRDNTNGRFIYWDGETGELKDGRIASGQSFWVRTTDDDAMFEIHEQAKVTPDAQFFREDVKAEIDYVEVMIKGKTTYDNVVIRTRKGAVKQLDTFDALKLKNDFFTLSVLSSDLHKLAISAIDSFSCSEVIPLVMEFARDANQQFITSPKGVYRLTINPHGLAKNSRIRIHDSYTGQVTDEQQFDFEIDDNNDSYAIHRFYLTIESTAILDESPGIIADDYNCVDNDYKILLVEPLQGLEYETVYLNHIINGRRDKGQYEIIIPGKLLAAGTHNTVWLRASSLCARNTIDTLVVWQEKPIRNLMVTQDLRCLDGPVTFHVIGADEHSTFRWFAGDSLASDVQSESTVFTTPWISENTTYYVAPISGNGCAGNPIKVVPEVVQYDEMSIHQDGSLLVSNYDFTEWFLDGNPISDQVRFITPTSPGLYTARVTIKGCTSEDHKTIGLIELPVDVTPNPFKDELQIKIDTDFMGSQLSLISIKGDLIATYKVVENEMTIDTSSLSNGVYVVKIAGHGKVYTLKVVK